MIPKESEVLSTGSTQKTSSSFNPDELNYFICGICGKKANGTLHNHFQHAKACIQMKRHSVICLYCPQDVLPSLPGRYLDNYFNSGQLGSEPLNFEHYKYSRFYLVWYWGTISIPF